ncbi:MAG: DUF2752 domain-containing protein [bacterium]
MIPTGARLVTALDRRRAALALGLAGAGFVVALWVLRVRDPSLGGYPPCLFHRWTGLLCPGCGTLRALHALLHGNLALAVRDNLLTTLVLPIVAVELASRWSRAIWRWPRVRVGILDRFPRAVAAIVVLFTLLRNVPAEPFSWLAPPRQRPRVDSARPAGRTAGLIPPGSRTCAWGGTGWVSG